MRLRSWRLIAMFGAPVVALEGCRDQFTNPAGAETSAVGAAAAAAGLKFTYDFRLDRCEFQTTGRNPYFLLVPGLKSVLEGVVDGERVRLVITVLHETVNVDGIPTRVVEERESVDGKLAEISRNYFAHCKENGSVFYFGEAVDFYENGKVVSHEGSWRHGVNGATAGVIMPGLALLGARYYQEVAPGVALDRAEIVDDAAEVGTPLRRFRRALLTRETTPLDPSDVGRKYYVAGIGLVADEALRLVEIQGN